MRPCTTVPLSIALACSTAAIGGITYDALTHREGRVTFLSEDEIADDTILAPGSPLTLKRVDVGVRMIGADSYSGTMTVRLWTDGGGQPGALIAEQFVPITFSDDHKHIVPVPFPLVDLPSEHVWTGVQFSLQDGRTVMGFLDDELPPLIGSSTDLRARHYPDDTWSAYYLPASMHFRLATIPAPGAGLFLLGTSLTLARRRRSK